MGAADLRMVLQKVKKGDSDVLEILEQVARAQYKKCTEKGS
jgi:hypothetical protein